MERGDGETGRSRTARCLPMRYRTLGDSVLLVSVIGLDCINVGGRLDVNATRAVADAAIDVGIMLFGASGIYGTGGGSGLAPGEVLARPRGHGRARHEGSATSEPA